MSGIATWGLDNTARDLTGILSTLVQDQPMFLKRFPLRAPAASVKHEWLEDALKPRSAAFTAFDPASGRFTVADAGGWSAGDILRIKGDPALFKVESASAGAIAVSLLAPNGSNIASLADVTASEGTLIYDHRPIPQGSNAGESLFSQSGTEYNYTEIIRGDVEITNTALAVKTYGHENAMPYQLRRAMLTILRQANNICLFGNRGSSSPSALAPGRAGGLYFFGTQPGCLSVGALGAPLSLKLINDAAQNILDAGGNPDLVLCGPGQARVISQLMRGQIALTPGETRRGSFANMIVSESTGQVMDVFIEPNLSSLDSDVWVLDSSSLGMVYLRDRQLHSEPATAPGYDGQKWTILGEFTFEFKNAKQKICRVQGLQDSAAALV
ncbi:MAG: DUF5309 family protein [Thermoguttaceae bacterium]|nr:DUF5309 family protein [Thermoguttaceae bacterium]